MQNIKLLNHQTIEEKTLKAKVLKGNTAVVYINKINTTVMQCFQCLFADSIFISVTGNNYKGIINILNKSCINRLKLNTNKAKAMILERK